MNWTSILTLHTKINFKYIKVLSVKGKIREISNVNKGEYSHDVGIGKDFFEKTQKALWIKKKRLITLNIV